MVNNYNSKPGIRIFRATNAEGRNAYTPNLFYGEAPKPGHDQNTFKTYWEIPNIKLLDSVNSLCLDASAQKITESQLIDKLNELFERK